MFKMCCGDCGECWWVGNPRACKCPDEEPKREWVGLTYEDMIEVWNKLYKERTDVMPLPTTFAKAIEAKLKQKNGYAEEKNTPQPAAQDNAFEELAKAVREYATEQRAIEAKLKQKNGYAEEKNT